MSQPLVSDVISDAQALLADPSGLWATSAILIPNFQRAYRQMYDALAMFHSNRVTHTVYLNLPAYTSVMNPVQNGITDMSEPYEIYERGGLTTGVISATDANSPIKVTSTAHGLSTNADVIVGGVTSTVAPWGRWFVTVADANNFTLNGSVANGVAGSNGFWSTSTDKFMMMEAVNTIEQNRDPGPALLDYTWQNSQLYFRGANQARQLMLVYIASGTAPSATNTAIGIDNCLNFLGAATAFYTALARTWPTADNLRSLAFGPHGEADDTGGYLRNLIASAVLEMQRKKWTKPPFRPNRTLTNYPWFL